MSLSSLFCLLETKYKGSSKSGNFGHGGIPGHLGGSTSKGGGSKSAAPKAAPVVSKANVLPQKEAVASKVILGKHVRKLGGNVEEAKKYLAEIDEMDKTFDGKLLKVLKKHPLGSLNVGTADGASGTYNGTFKKITIDPYEGDISQYDKKDIIGGGSSGMTVKGMNKAILSHEMGHHIIQVVFNEAVNGGLYKKSILDGFKSDKKKVTKYAKTDPEEYFSESFAAYHVAPNSLSISAKKMVEDVMKRAGELS